MLALPYTRAAIDSASAPDYLPHTYDPLARRVATMDESQLKPARILVVDDDDEHASTLQRLLTREGLEATVAHGAEEALKLARAQEFDLILTDLVMSGMSGLDLMRALTDAKVATDVILMTAFGTVEVAVEAMRSGAYDFVVKPIKRATLLKAMDRALAARRLRAENLRLRAELEELRRGRQLVGDAPLFRRALQLATQTSASDATVLLRGESGTGKELFARHIHACSRRAKGPFIAVNCASLPESLVESELFGHEAGAFTGATHRRAGWLELAHGGTLLLDEVGEIPLAMQVKLLRFIQEGTLTRVGGRQALSVQVRIVAATHRNLEEMVKAGEFREDLYFRLNVIPIIVPPLRSRAEDIPLLVTRFVTLHAAQVGRPVPRVTPAAMERLSAYGWPGNVRELENAMERAVVLDQDGRLDLDDLPEVVSEATPDGAGLHFSIGTTLAEAERRLILATLAYTTGDKAAAAEILGMGRRTVYRKLEEYGKADSDDVMLKNPERE